MRHPRNTLEAFLAAGHWQYQEHKIEKECQGGRRKHTHTYKEWGENEWGGVKDFTIYLHFKREFLGDPQTGQTYKHSQCLPCKRKSHILLCLGRRGLLDRNICHLRRWVGKL